MSGRKLLDPTTYTTWKHMSSVSVNINTGLVSRKRTPNVILHLNGYSVITSCQLRRHPNCTWSFRGHVTSLPAAKTGASPLIRGLGYFFVRHPVILQTVTLSAARCWRYTSNTCALLRDFTQRKIIPYRRFGTTSVKGLLDPWGWNRNVSV